MNKNKLYYILYSPIASLFLRMKGVTIGKRVLFGGMPCFVKTRGADIFVGNHCRFMSKPLGNNLGINHRCIVSTQNSESHIIIGNNCGFSGTSIWCFDRISIGNNVKVGANVVIMDGDAHQDDPRAGENAPITISDNVWIGANSIVLKGVTIGRNSLIGAGSVVVKDIPDNVVAAGNPCRVIKPLTNDVINVLNAQK